MVLDGLDGHGAFPLIGHVAAEACVIQHFAVHTKIKFDMFSIQISPKLVIYYYYY